MLLHVHARRPEALGCQTALASVPVAGVEVEFEAAVMAVVLELVVVLVAHLVVAGQFGLLGQRQHLSAQMGWEQQSHSS